MDEREGNQEIDSHLEVKNKEQEQHLHYCSLQSSALSQPLEMSPQHRGRAPSQQEVHSLETSAAPSKCCDASRTPWVQLSFDEMLPDLKSKHYWLLSVPWPRGHVQTDKPLTSKKSVLISKEK